jgi:bacillithiol system protein YtxJ
MFGWWGKVRGAGRADAIPEIDAHTDLDGLFREQAVILFKHSTACPVSWAAHAHVMRFRAQNRSVPVYLVPVLRQRAASRAIAERTGVPHESPQIILVRNGVAAETASHGEITHDRLAGILATAIKAPETAMP